MTIYRGPGGGGNATSDAEITTLTALTNQALAYSESAAIEADAAANSAAAASTSAANAATSASGAATSATNAASSASSASTSATNAAASASAAATSATNAASSATSAAASASTATTQAGIATTQASNAATSASNASASATNAATSYTNTVAIYGSTVDVANAVSASQTSATNAATSASAASTSATAAAGSATTASTQATNAAASASTASTQASNAATSATNAASSATTATTQAGIATTQATQAAASAASAAAIVTGVASNRPSIRPSLLLDFAATKALDPRITFTRASTATYYDGKTTAKAEQNLVNYSQDFSNAYWTKSLGSYASNSIVAPDGTTTAGTFTGTAAFAALVNPSVPVSGTVFTYSVYAQANSFGQCELILASSVAYTNYCAVLFNLSTGAFISQRAGGSGYVVTGYTITNVGGTWYRLTMSITAPSNTTILVNHALGANAVNTSSVNFWGAQLEQRSAATAYTPTTTAAIINYIPTLLTAASGAARFDNSPTTSESLGLLIEESRTNLVTYSEQLENSAWNKDSNSAVVNTNVAPDGTLTADSFIENTTTGPHQFTRANNLSFTSGTAYTLTFYLKQNGRSRLSIQADVGASTFPAAATAIYDLSTGTIVSTGASATATITSIGNNWYRCSFTATATATVSNRPGFYMMLISSGTTTSYTGNGFSGIFIWGAQLEAGAFATSYIPTVASQVTRAADNAIMAGTNFSSWYRQDLGTIYADFVGAPLPSSGASPIWVSSLAGGPTIGDNDAGNLVRTGLNNVAYTSNGTVTVTGTPYKIAYRVQGGNYASSVNGGTIESSSLATNPTAQIQVYLGTTVSGQYFNSTIKKLAYYPKALTNAELQGLTS